MWCSERGLDPLTAPIGGLADFLLHLFNDLKLGPSSIKGHRSAINSVWRVAGRPDSDSHCLKALLDSFSVDRPRSTVTLPKWDLALVLRVLSKEPYEPIQVLDFKKLSSKTVFLLLLASARRRSDIHAIDPRNLTYTRHGVILEPIARFIPKARSCAAGEKRYAPISIRSLDSITDDPQELTLCPVRALRAYDKIASTRVENRERFFISTNHRGSSVCLNTISAWVVKLIREAYNQASDADCRLYQTSVHEVRALAASMAFQATFSLDNVLAAAQWAQPTTFIDHYMRDVSGMQGRIHKINPCIIAGAVFH